MIIAAEKGGNVSVVTLAKLAAPLGLTELPLGKRLRITSNGADGDRLAALTERIVDDATELRATIERARAAKPFAALPTRDVTRAMITLTEDELPTQLVQLRAAFAKSADAEFRRPFRGRRKHLAPRAFDVAAGHGAELFSQDEEEERLREIPEHYYDLGVRMVLRAVGTSLIGRGIVDRDLLFIKPTPLPETGQVIVCRVNAYGFVKIFERAERTVRLISANPLFEPIEVDPDVDDFQCFGVVVGRSGYVPATDTEASS
jgi:SOS-response transcriptional repressor LexA